MSADHLTPAPRDECPPAAAVEVDAPPLRAEPENSALQELRRQMHNDAAVDQFVADFLMLLDQRMASLAALMGSHQDEESAIVLLSLETSGEMVGADDFARIAREMHRAIGSEDSCRIAALYPQLIAAGHRTKQLLSHS